MYLIIIGLSAFINAQGITNTLGGNSSTDKFIIENNSGTDLFTITGDAKVGIGTSTPGFKLDVIGTIQMSGFKLSSSPTSGFVLTCDANGIGTWQAIPTSSGDNDWTISGDNIYSAVSGNVGIGTTNPISKLQVGGYIGDNAMISSLAEAYMGMAVYGKASYSSGTNYGGFFVALGTYGRGVYGYAEGTDGYGVFGYVNGSQGCGVIGKASHSSGTNYGGYFEGEGSSSRGVFGYASQEYGLNYGIYGKSNSQSGYDFYADGVGTDYGAASSIRWKNNIVEIEKPLDKLAELHGVYFNWDEEHGGQHDIGCIAEEVGKVLPEIVVYEENGIDASGMDYSKLTPLLIEAVNALQKIVESQQEQIETLENR